jgi:hypothetical protein
MMVMGVGIAGVWTRDILAGELVDLSEGLFQARDGDDGSLLWLHWLAEYTTAACLTVGGIGLLSDSAWGGPLAGLALGALFYTSVNSLGWALARRERRAYRAPMIAGVLVSLLGAVYLITG